MCCDCYVPGDKSDFTLGMKCWECDGPVDRDGDTLSNCCVYGNEECSTCGYRPCDGSC